MGGSRPHLDFCFCFGKSSQIALNQYYYFGVVHIFCLYTLLKAVSYSELSVLSMSVMGFQKNVDGGHLTGWVGVVSSIEVYFGFLELF